MNTNRKNPSEQPSSTPTLETEVVTQITEEELENVTGAGSFPALMQTEYQTRGANQF